jgi:ATP-dependent Zn protease
MPGVEERTRIWQLQVHPYKTPLAPDVDFKKLAQRHDAVSGGDIKNAVIKAAAAAAAEPGIDAGKKIHQKHFETAIEDVIAARKVMQQSVFTDEQTAVPEQLSERHILVSNSQSALIISLVLAGAAFLASLVAIVLAYIR